MFTKITLVLGKPSDVVLLANGVVWAKGDNGLYYSLPHYSYGKTILKLPQVPHILTIYCKGTIKSYKVLKLDPARRFSKI